MSNKEQAKTYRQLKADLDNVMLGLQNEELGVDEAIELYGKGQELLKQLEDYLNESENHIKQIKAKFE